MFTTIPFKKGDFPLQYKGDFISAKEGEECEENYPEEAGNFLYFFSDNGNVGIYLTCKSSKVNWEKSMTL